MDYYQFIFQTAGQEENDLLIALLADIGFEGFEEENLLLKAFIKEEQFNKIEFENIIEDRKIIYSKSIIQQINWNEKWEKEFEAVTVFYPGTNKPFAVVRADFHKRDENILHDIVITPKMSFGTGHHVTTYLMMQQMSLLNFKNKTVIDFGTGTAVLSILAEKLGASKIYAIDNDDWSVNNAIENISTNNCKDIDIVKADSIESGMKADIILANINLNIIISNLETIKAACNPASVLLFSGMFIEDKNSIEHALKEKGFSTEAMVTRNNWLMIMCSYQ